MESEIDLKQLGRLLLSELKEEEFSARGAINELFPYVFEASNRMSGRAISRWLGRNGLKISAATICKALRNPRPYWDDLFDWVEPAARLFLRGHRGELEPTLPEFLLDEQYFELLADKPPQLDIVTREGGVESFSDYEKAVEILRDWYDFSRRVREACLANVETEEEEALEPAEAAS